MNRKETGYRVQFDKIVSRFEDAEMVEVWLWRTRMTIGCVGVFDEIEKVDEMILDRDYYFGLDVGLFNLNCWMFINFFQEHLLFKSRKVFYI